MKGVEQYDDDRHSRQISQSACPIAPICHDSAWLDPLHPGNPTDIFAGSSDVFVRGGPEVSRGNTIARSAGPFDPQDADSSLSSSPAQQPIAFLLAFHEYLAFGPTHRPGHSTERTRTASWAVPGGGGHFADRRALMGQAPTSVKGCARPACRWLGAGGSSAYACEVQA